MQVATKKSLVKNYPNQVSSFDDMRSALQTIADIHSAGVLDPLDDGDVGYELVARGVMGFRDLPADAGPAQLAARIAAEKLKNPSLQGPRTTARELRRTLRGMGWLDDSAIITPTGVELLASEPGGVEEQALLVEGLMGLVATDVEGDAHHPVQTMLRLLAIAPSQNREGLELALEPLNDSDAEFARVAAIYPFVRADRLSQLGITETQRANAVKIFPTLAVTAGLVVREQPGNWYSLTQDGWRVIGKTPPQARRAIARRRGRRTTVGKLIDAQSAARRSAGAPPRSLSAEEQARAADKLRERTASHQRLVQRTALFIGDENGLLFEDEFSYDLLWVPEDKSLPAVLFEMKTIADDIDAYLRVRHAVGQLSYYEFFHVRPTLPDRPVMRAAVFNAAIPQPLVDYLHHEGVAALVVPEDTAPTALNPLGQQMRDMLL